MANARLLRGLVAETGMVPQVASSGDERTESARQEGALQVRSCAVPVLVREHLACNELTRRKWRDETDQK